MFTRYSRYSTHTLTQTDWLCSHFMPSSPCQWWVDKRPEATSQCHGRPSVPLGFRSSACHLGNCLRKRILPNGSSICEPCALGPEGRALAAQKKLSLEWANVSKRAANRVKLGRLWQENYYQNAKEKELVDMTMMRRADLDEIESQIANKSVTDASSLDHQSFLYDKQSTPSGAAAVGAAAAVAPELCKELEERELLEELEC